MNWIIYTILIFLEYESKFNSLAEEKDQLENFQTQEIAKIKHLVSCSSSELYGVPSAYFIIERTHFLHKYMCIYL